MNTYQTNKIRRSIFDFLFAAFVIMFIMFAILSPTLGNSNFCKSYANKDSSVTSKLQEQLKQATDEIANQTGIVPQAFDFAVGGKKISSTQKEIVEAVYAGNNFDYSNSAGIETAYNNGITEYYRFNGLELDTQALERAVPMACAAFNKTFSVRNITEMRNFVALLSKYSIVFAAAFLVLAGLVGLKIFDLHGGRTKVFGHYGSALICAGDSLILIAICDIFIHFADRLYLTNNVCFNSAFSSASRIYFICVAAFGIALDIAGVSMINYVRRYYHSKAKKQQQEDDINRSLYVKRFDGEDMTIKEIVDNRRKGYEEHKNGTN